MSVEVLTFGCRLNAYESEVIRTQAQDSGLSDAIVVNTCAVTAEAVRQARQAIRKARRERPQARIVVTGCADRAGHVCRDARSGPGAWQRREDAGRGVGRRTPRV
jgi:tRNA A37 methylthiotransferase MiaB